MSELKTECSTIWVSEGVNERMNVVLYDKSLVLFERILVILQEVITATQCCLTVFLHCYSLLLLYTYTLDK